MTEITNNDHQHSKGHKPRTKKLSTRVDMTPMVDLGFLLIAFFMLTMVMDRPRQMKLDKRMSTDQEPVSECRVLNVLIDSADVIYTYEGSDLKTLKPTSFDADKGVRQGILAKAKQVKNSCGNDRNGKPREMICLIKLLPGARYKNMVAILDEMEITETHLYSLQEPVAEEINELKQQSLLAANTTKP